MAYKFNPFTGKLDETGAGGGGGTPGGSDTQVQFNDGGTFGGDAGLTYNKTTDELTLAGDLNLDDGVGGNTTTIQAVTPSANRTISFPDATGTVALVNGANGTIQYNDAGTLKGNSDFTVDPDWNDAAVTFTGLKLNVTDTASAIGSNLLDLQQDNTSFFRVVAGVGAGTVTLDRANTPILRLFQSTGGVGRFDPTQISFSAAGGTGAVALARAAAGVVKITDGSTGTGYIKQDPVLTTNLPNAVTVGAGTRGFVSDAGTLTFNSPIGAGTGTPSANTTIPVFSDGSVWKAG